MKKIVLILILIISLNSCGNNIEKKESELNKLKELNKVEELNKDNKIINKVEEVNNIEKDILENKKVGIKDLGYGFSIESIYSNENYTYKKLYYKKTLLSEGHDYNIKNYENFFIISIGGRVTVIGNIIFDKNNNELYKIGEGNINQIEEGIMGLYLLVQSIGFDKVVYINKEGIEKVLMKNNILENIENSPEVIVDFYINSFELLENKKVKIFYTEDEIKKEKIIDIK